MYSVTVTKTQMGQWRWGILDPDAEEVQGGAGYDSEEDAQEYAQEALADWLERLIPQP